MHINFVGFVMNQLILLGAVHCKGITIEFIYIFSTSNWFFLLAGNTTHLISYYHMDLVKLENKYVLSYNISSKMKFHTCT